MHRVELRITLKPKEAYPRPNSKTTGEVMNYAPFSFNKDIQWNSLVECYSLRITNRWLKDKMQQGLVRHWLNEEGYPFIVVSLQGVLNKAHPDVKSGENCIRNFLNTVLKKLVETEDMPGLDRSYGGAIVDNFYVMGPRDRIPEKEKPRRIAQRENRQKRKAEKGESEPSAKRVKRKESTRKIEQVVPTIASPPVQQIDAPSPMLLPNLVYPSLSLQWLHMYQLSMLAAANSPYSVPIDMNPVMIPYVAPTQIAGASATTPTKQEHNPGASTLLENPSDNFWRYDNILCPPSLRNSGEFHEGNYPDQQIGSASADESLFEMDHYAVHSYPTF